MGSLDEYNKIALVSFVLTIVSFIIIIFNYFFSISLFWIITLMLSSIALVLSFIALFEMKLTQEKGKSLVLAIVGIFLLNIIIVLFKR